MATPEALKNQTDFPRVTIITVALNAEKHIEQTISSVVNQSYRFIEYILIDGGSSDGTINIINRFSDYIDHVISEKDEGIADAMNKGLALATGAYVLFLHADDYLKHDRSVADAVQFFDNADIVACNIEFGKDHRLCRPRGFSAWTNFKQGIYHQGTFCRKSLMEKLDGFDNQFRITMDYDFFLRAYHMGAGFVKAPVLLSVMRDTGISSRKDWKNLKIRFAEEKRVHRKNCKSFVMKAVYKIYWSLYLPYRYACHVMKTGLLQLLV